MTPQETKAAVLAECERLCNGVEHKRIEILDGLFIWFHKDDPFVTYSISTIFNNICTLTTAFETDEATYRIAFRLLGLKEPQEIDKDAVKTVIADTLFGFSGFSNVHNDQDFLNGFAEDVINAINKQ